MPYAPSEAELSSLKSASAEERLHYFLTRAMESEEVWGLGDRSGWRIKEVADKEMIAVWPYKPLAEACAGEDLGAAQADAVSLEQFVDRVLKLMADQRLLVEVFPTPTQPGHILHARELGELFESMMDSGEYFLEG